MLNTRRLRAEFQRDWSAVGASGDGEPVWRELSSAYAEPQRRYHTLEHIEACLAWLDWSWSLAERPHELALALWFHDWVYDARARDNEERSAQQALSRLQAAGVSEAAQARIAALVRATAGHHAEQGDAALLVDIDLAILGSSRERFAAFERTIREEYRSYDDESYRRGRSQVLTRLLARDPLYQTPFLRAELEDRARANLGEALLRLSAGGV